MAKKKKTPLPTPDQLKKLAAVLIDTRRNAYHEANNLGFELDDDGWQAMEKQEKLFRCEECSLWQPWEHRAYDSAEHCVECEEMRAGDDLD